MRMHDMATLLPVNTKVVLSHKGKKRWGPSFGNPHDVVGTLIQNNLPISLDEEGLEFVYKVRWDNGYDNVYANIDLEPVQLKPLGEFL